MFESQTGKPLNEDQFDRWLEDGRTHNLGYRLMMVVWSIWESDYHVVYAEDHEQMRSHIRSMSLQEEMMAIYDVYSESRINLQD